MKTFLVLYIGYLKAFFRSQMEYRTAWISGMFANFYCYLITFMTFRVLTWKFNDIAGWGFSELTILYGLNLTSYAIAGTLFWGSVLFLEELIVDGSLDRYLLRPVGLLQQMVLTQFGYTFLGQIAVSLLFISYAYIDLRLVSWPILLYSLYALVGGVFFQSGAMIFFGALSFWTMRTGELSDVLYYDIRELTNYPLRIYPNAISFLLTFILPWALINYYPSMIILRKAESAFDYGLGLISPLIGIVIFMAAYLFFYHGVKRYDGTGS